MRAAVVIICRMRNNPDRLLTLAETADCLGISLRQLRRLVDLGRVRCVTVSERCPRIRQTDLYAYLDSVVIDRKTPSPI